MSNESRRSPQIKKLARPLIATGLIAGGLFQLVPPVLSLGTEAGTNIINRATATYQDPDGNPIEAISNTVTVIVDEVAGITAVPDKIVDTDGGALEAGDGAEYYFTVTNTGNDPNKFQVPTSVTTQNFTVIPTGNIRVEYDANNNGIIDVGEVYTYNGTAFLNPSNVDFATVDIPADTSFSVVVTGTVPNTGVSSGDPVSVTLGATPTVGDQNIAYGATGTGDLYTLDTTPSNGQREASATQSIPFASSVNPLALAKVKKSDTAYVPGDLSTYTDDLITYKLDLSVDNVDPSNLFQPASLAGTNITLDGAVAQRILVSDVIPTDTQLSSVSTGLPAGWQVVYSTDNPTTVGQEAPTTTRWWTTFGGGTGQPANLAAVKRIGFVYNGSLAPAYDTATQTGSLSFTVQVTSASTTDGLAIYNVAQVLGTTQGGDPTNIIYDESGDNNPNNFSDDGTPKNPDGSDYNPATDLGAPGTPAVADTDDGTNTGTDTTPAIGGGEPLLSTLTLVAAPDDILIGPNGQPAASGPDGTQDTDFTNKSNAFTPVDANNDDIIDAFDPAEIVFINTIQNPATTGFIANVTVEPADIALSGAAAGDIPPGTVVRITNGVSTAYYVYQAAGTWSGPFAADLTTPTAPVVLDTQLVAGEVQQVTVGIDLPSLTGITPATLPSYPITLVVFPEDNPATPGYTGEVTYNLTIDRLYPAGYVELLKESRIYSLQSNGTYAAPTAYSTANGNAKPGDIIEYRITYTNISEAASGFGNTILPATSFQVVENGTTGTNNWALDNDANGTVDTLHQNGSVASAGSIQYFFNAAAVIPDTTTDPADDVTVQKYINNVGTVAPQVTGTFTFQRELQ